MLFIERLDGSFFSIHLQQRTSLSVQIRKDPNNTSDYLVTFRSIGEALDIVVNPGPTFQDLVFQYQDTVGRPKMLPLWAHGLFLRSLSFNDPDRISPVIDEFVKEGFSLQGIALNEETLGGDYNFKFEALLKDLMTKYPDLNFILPFSPLVPLDTNESDQISANLTMLGADRTYPVQVQKDSVDALCMDSLNKNLSSQYLAPLFKAHQESITPATSAFWLNKNTPQLTGNNQTGTADPYANLPYYPGLKTPSEGSLPENAYHQAEDGLLRNFYARSTFGSELAS